MSSKKRVNRSIREKNQIETAETANGDTADNDASDSPHLPLSVLTNEDPSTLTTIFEPSKIKNFLYKVEPTMSRINASSLDLISTTATVLLKTLVEKAVLQEQEDRKDTTIRKDANNNNKTQSPDLQVERKSVLITSNRMKSVIESTSGPSALNFLEDTFENFRDKDGSFLPSKLSEYVPRAAQKRKPKAKNQSVATLTGDRSTTTSIQATSGQAESRVNETKRLKTNHAYKGASSLLLSNEFVSNSYPVERAIAQAAAATEHYEPEKIVQDEDDYD